MAGGVFIRQNKTRPGFYHKFTAANRARNLSGLVGVAALALELDWGPDGMQRLDVDASYEEAMLKLGRSIADVLPVRECLKQAETLYFYRVNADGATKATLDMTPQPVVATAKHGGTRGNDIRVQIEVDPDNTSVYNVKTYVDEIERDAQYGITNAEDIQANDWVDFSGTGAITAAAGGSLVNGANGAANVNEHNKFLSELESYEFNAFGLIVDDPALKAMYAAACKHFADDLGKLVQCIVPDYSAAYEGVSSVINGVILVDGTVIDKAMAVAWVTGTSAAAGPAFSLTNEAYNDAIEPDVRMKDSDIKAALKSGNILFRHGADDQGQPIAAIEQDINTLIRFTEDRQRDWSKNRIVRALYYLTNTLNRVWHQYYMGKVDNNVTGRNLFKGDVVIMMNALVAAGAFRDFDAETDVEIMQGEQKDAVVCNMWVTPVDAMEKMYFTVEVR